MQGARLFVLSPSDGGKTSEPSRIGAEAGIRSVIKEKKGVFGERTAL
jgi:hypothetical protein